ncbi:MAG: transporter, family, cyanate transporter, partial [Kribbellaceae bacterium]|nr:transporter, family, cyanate transporter [Kribbellaceae bacterium]
TSTPIAPEVEGEGAPPVSVWRQPMAWLVTAYMGLQSTSFYVFVTWLPTIEISNGFSDRAAGIHCSSSKASVWSAASRSRG